MNILIVDDDPDLVALARRWLEREGHAVDHVGTGPAALEMLALDPLPDLVLLDVMLPRIDGFAVLKKIRADARLARLPVMIVSGVADRHAGCRARQGARRRRLHRQAAHGVPLPRPRRALREGEVRLSLRRFLGR